MIRVRAIRQVTSKFHHYFIVLPAKNDRESFLMASIAQTFLRMDPKIGIALREA